MITAWLLWRRASARRSPSTSDGTRMRYSSPSQQIAIERIVAALEERAMATVATLGDMRWPGVTSRARRAKPRQPSASINAPSPQFVITAGWKTSPIQRCSASRSTIAYIHQRRDAKRLPSADLTRYSISVSRRKSPIARPNLRRVRRIIIGGNWRASCAIDRARKTLSIGSLLR